ncbi:MAG: MotA/TolQ/ExbB proton channel family protein [Sedimentisphaerales bacterium]|nr:MotA/TolQ/ExbB proton channel family protein [Sedimentisphaerales bacterium]
MKQNIRFMVMAPMAFFALKASLAFSAEDPGGAGNGYFQRFFVDGGPIVWFILLPLSLLTVSLIVQYFLVIRRANLLPAAVMSRMEKLAQASPGRPMRDFLQQEENFLTRCVRVALAQPDAAARENALMESLEQQSTALLRKIEWLNIIGNVAPMIGLFGTVWGMIEAFNRIVRAQGQPEPDQLAGAISIALVTTLWGLFTAIPALAAYGSLRNRIDAITAETAIAAENLLRLLPPEESGAAT